MIVRKWLIFYYMHAFIMCCIFLLIFLSQKCLADEKTSYPVKIYPVEKVPVPFWSLPTSVAWIDNHTIIYKTIPAEGDVAKTTSLIAVNLDTLERKDIDIATHHGTFCYDTLSKNIVYSTSIQKHDPKWWTIEYKQGVLGEALKNIKIEDTKSKSGQLFINPFDCSFHYPFKWDNPDRSVEGVYMRELPRLDGRIGRQQQKNSPPHPYGTLLYEAPDGKTKVVPSDEGGFFLPSFEHFSGLYWHYNYNRFDRTVRVWHYDRQFNLLSLKTYPPGPWGTGQILHTMKLGYLIYRSVAPVSGKLFLLTLDGEVIEVFHDLGFRGNLSVSPDGCKAIFLHQEEEGCCKVPQQLASVTFC